MKCDECNKEKVVQCLCNDCFKKDIDFIMKKKVADLKKSSIDGSEITLIRKGGLFVAEYRLNELYLYDFVLIPKEVL